MASTIFVAPDPQFGVARILRPYHSKNGDAVSRYEGGLVPTLVGDYQDEPVTRPILLTENGAALDSLAGTTGYQNNLVAATHTPIGCRCLFWLPRLRTRNLLSPPLVNYQYTLMWRLRNIQDFNSSKGAYHFPIDSLLAGDVIKPAAYQSIQYNETEPTGDGSFGQANVRTIQVNILADTDTQPLTPALVRDTTGTLVDAFVEQFQQLGEELPGFSLYETRALGDELIVGITRSDEAGENWDFAGVTAADFPVANFFNNTNTDPERSVGVYLFLGIAP